jgi:hypothetical protein
VFSFNGKPQATVLLEFSGIKYTKALIFLEARFPMEMPAEPREPGITGLSIVHISLLRNSCDDSEPDAMRCASMIHLRIGTFPAEAAFTADQNAMLTTEPSLKLQSYSVMP